MAGGWTVVDVATLNSTELAATVQEYMLLAAEQYDDLDCDAAEAELTPTAVGTQVRLQCCVSSAAGPALRNWMGRTARSRPAGRHLRRAKEPPSHWAAVFALLHLLPGVSPRAAACCRRVPSPPTHPLSSASGRSSSL